MKCLIWKLISGTHVNRYATFQNNTLLKRTVIAVKNAYFQKTSRASTQSKPLIVDFVPWCYVLIDE
jgi:hypothetical protein